MSDSEYINTRWFDYEKRVRELQTLTNKTKEQIIKEGEELTALKIEYKLLDIPVTEISSYLFIELNRLTDSNLNEPEFSRRYIQMKVNPDHKQEKELYEIVSHVDWKEIETSDESIFLEKSKHDGIKINGQEYIPKSERNQENTQEKIKIIDKNTSYSKWLDEMRKTANKFELTLQKLWEEYNKSDNVQELLESKLLNIEDRLYDAATTYVDIASSKDLIDDRRDFGEFEKIMARFVIETGETIARVAQLMDYSEKYGSIGILREPKVVEFFETEGTYPLFLRSCPKCLVDISQLMNKNISLYRECVNLSIAIPSIKYNKR